MSSDFSRIVSMTLHRVAIRYGGDSQPQRTEITMSSTSPGEAQFGFIDPAAVELPPTQHLDITSWLGALASEKCDGYGATP
jgi:hypothetical protein